MGKLNAYADSGEVIKTMFGDKFTRISLMLSCVVNCLYLAWAFSNTLCLAMFLPVMLQVVIKQYIKKVDHI